MKDAIKPRWAPRLSPEKIRRLYESEAAGLLDEDLLDEVFVDMYLRCESISKATAFHHGGPFECPGCGHLIEERDRSAGWRERLKCPRCCWSMTAKEYLRTYQGRQVYAGGSLPAVEDFLGDVSRTRAPRDKMLMIDRVIHAFHYETVQNPGRPVAANLIGGKTAQVLAFLHGLTNGTPRDPLLRERIAKWRKTASQVQEKHAKHGEKTRSKKETAKRVKAERSKRDALRKKCRHVRKGQQRNALDGQQAARK